MKLFAYPKRLDGRGGGIFREKCGIGTVQSRGSKVGNFLPRIIKRTWRGKYKDVFQEAKKPTHEKRGGGSRCISKRENKRREQR